MKEILENKKLSWKAKGLMAYLISIKDNGDIFKNKVVNNSKDGYESMNSGFKELVKIGLISEEEKKSNEGKFLGVILKVNYDG